MVCLSGIRFFDAIKDLASKSSSNTLHVFVAATYVDSLVSLKILSDLLQGESILYSVFPVYGYDEIRSHTEKGMQDDSETYVAVFINCGANRDLNEVCRPGETTHIFVLDSHRPVDVVNIAHQRIYVAWTEEDEKQDATLQDDVIEFFEMEAEERESDGEEEGEQTRKRTRRDELVDRIQQYKERGTSFSRPTGCIMYDIAQTMKRSDNFHLWLACVAATDHYIHARAAPEKYREICNKLELEINNGGNVDKPRTILLEDGISVRVPDEGRIGIDDDLFLMCLRRWDLFSSLKYSTYSSTKLQTWSEPGRKRLIRIFAQMGIHLEQATMQYKYMDSAIKNRLMNDIKDVAPKFGMEDITFRSFQLSHGYRYNLTAADLVYGVTALLESPAADATDQYDSFFTALSAMSLLGWEEVQRGMDMAIRLQQAIINIGSEALRRTGAGAVETHGRLKKKGQFYALTLAPQVNAADAALVAHPLALQRLVYFIKDAQREEGKKALPFVAAVVPPGSTKYLVLGVVEKPSIEDRAKGNAFKLEFEKAAARCDMELKASHFDGACCEVEINLLDNFLSNLAAVRLERT